MKPAAVIEALYDLLRSANSMSAEHFDGSNAADRVWAGDVYAPLSDAFFEALTAVYGHEISADMRDRVSSLFGEDIDFDALAAELRAEKAELAAEEIA